MTASLQQLLQRPDIWRSRDRRLSLSGAPTGFAALDRALQGGWPRGALSELLLAQPGSGELHLLTPLLADLSKKKLLQIWINPPLIPYAPALAQHGLDLESIVIVHGEPRHHLWACEQALRSAACGAVLYWPAQSLRYAELRKLQVAAASQQAVGFLLRDIKFAQQTSPAVLRLQLQPGDTHLTLRILKQRGRESGQTLSLERPHALLPTSTFIASPPTQQPTPRLTLKIISASRYTISRRTAARLSSSPSATSLQ